MARPVGAGGGVSPSLTRMEIKRVLAVAQSQQHGELYTAAIQCLLCGMRVGELRDITREKLDPAGTGKVAASFVLGSNATKNGKPRTVWLSKSAQLALQELLPKLDEEPTTRVFPWNSSYACHKISSLLKLSGLNATTHSFRRTCLQILQKEQGMKIQQLQAVAGHSSPSVTLRYLDRSPQPIQDAFSKMSF